jgi:Uma2 family endonuclease
MGQVQQLVTAEQLTAHPGRCELVRGEIIDMTPAGGDHGQIELHLGGLIDAYVRANKLGMAYGAETGFHLERDPDTVRAPDVAFVRANRRSKMRGPGFLPGPPDLAVEVLSPDDRPGEVQAKVQSWLAAGCSLVWVVDPKSRIISVHRRGAKAQVLTVADRLSGEGVLPGFELPVAEVFAD